MASTRDEIKTELEDQVANLTRQVASLTKAMSKRGSSALADGRNSAADFYEEFHDRFADAMPAIRKQAHVARKAAHDNPVVTALVGVALLGLLASLVARR